MTDNTKLIAEARIRILSALTEPSEAECERLATFLGEVADALEGAELRIAELKRTVSAEIRTSDRLRTAWREDCAALAAAIEEAAKDIGEGLSHWGGPESAPWITAGLKRLTSADTGAVLREHDKALLSRVANDMPLYIDAEACRFIREYADREESKR